jgi:hypothetical protein
MNLKTFRMAVTPVLLLCPLVMWIAAQMKGVTLDRFQFTSTVIGFILGAVYLNRFVREQADSLQPNAPTAGSSRGHRRR